MGCERVKGKVRVRVNGGDVRLMGIEGPIDADVTRGNTIARGGNLYIQKTLMDKFPIPSY